MTTTFNNTTPLAFLKPTTPHPKLLVVILGLHGPLRLKSHRSGQYYSTASATLGDETCGQVELRFFGRDVNQVKKFRVMRVAVLENVEVVSGRDEGKGVWLKWRWGLSRVACYGDGELRRMLGRGEDGDGKVGRVLKWRKRTHALALRWARDGLIRDVGDDDGSGVERKSSVRGSNVTSKLPQRNAVEAVELG